MANLTTYLLADAKTNWGVWGDQQLCSNRSNVIGYRLKIQEDCGSFCDDTALNAIQLQCADGTLINSLVGSSGNWKNWQYCPIGRYLIGFRFRSEVDQGAFTDDTAGNEM